SGTQDELSLFTRHREFRNRPEPDAAPPVVVAAPRRHAVKVADVVHLRQREKLLPGERQRVFDQAADFELPLLERDRRLLAEVEHGPVLHLMLADRQPWHAVPIGRAGAFGSAAGEFNVDSAFVELELASNVFLPPLDEVVFGHSSFYGAAARL